MRILVCGGRDWCDILRMITVMDRMNEQFGPFKELIHGGYSGADEEANCWGLQRDMPTRVFKANWKKHGRAAGPLRNQQMLDEGKPDLVIAFPGSRGTKDMVARAEKAGVQVIRVDDEAP